MDQASTTSDIDRDESQDLISAQKVRGTTVYDASGERIGTIDDVMLTKRGGDVAYAVMSFGGFLGIGEKYHPLPWDTLEYDTSLGGYRVGATGESFRDAPSYSRDEMDRSDWADATDRYYDDASSSGRIGRRIVLGAGAAGGAAGGVTGSSGSFEGTGQTGAGLGTAGRSTGNIGGGSSPGGGSGTSGSAGNRSSSDF